MSSLLLVTLLAGLVGFILLLIGWSRVLNSASGDPDGVGPLSKKEERLWPDLPHYTQAGREIRFFRKQRRERGRGIAWRGSLQAKVVPLGNAFPNQDGEPMVIPESPTAQELDELLTELERRAGLAPIGQPNPSTIVQSESDAS